MTPEKLKSIFQKYCDEIQYDPWVSEEISPEKLPDEFYHRPLVAVGTSRAVKHLVWMCIEAQKFVDEGRIEKAMRWLGFIQASLWILNGHTLDKLKRDSMPDVISTGGEGG